MTTLLTSPLSTRISCRLQSHHRLTAARPSQVQNALPISRYSPRSNSPHPYPNPPRLAPTGYVTRETQPTADRIGLEPPLVQDDPIEEAQDPSEPSGWILERDPLDDPVDLVAEPTGQLRKVGALLTSVVIPVNSAHFTSLRHPK